MPDERDSGATASDEHSGRDRYERNNQAAYRIAVLRELQAIRALIAAMAAGQVGDPGAGDMLTEALRLGLSTGALTDGTRKALNHPYDPDSPF